VFLFCVSENPFNSFFSHRIDLLSTLRFSQLFHKIQIFLPDVRGQQLLPLLIGSAQSLAGTVLAVFRGAAVGSLSILVRSRMP
jgi:hypothetical protein